MRRIFLASLLMLTSCSGGSDVAGAEKAIRLFHQQLNAAAYDTIYAASDKGMKEATSEADLVKFLSVVHDKLGPFQAGTQTNWQVNYNTSGNTTVILYDSKFAKGEASETFTFVGGSDSPKLFAYSINSRTLITG